MCNKTRTHHQAVVLFVLLAVKLHNKLSVRGTFHCHKTKHIIAEQICCQDQEEIHSAVWASKTLYLRNGHTIIWIVCLYFLVCSFQCFFFFIFLFGLNRNHFRCLLGCVLTNSIHLLASWLIIFFPPWLLLSPSKGKNKIHKLAVFYISLGKADAFSGHCSADTALIIVLIPSWQAWHAFA